MPDPFSFLEEQRDSREFAIDDQDNVTLVRKFLVPNTALAALSLYEATIGQSFIDAASLPSPSVTSGRLRVQRITVRPLAKKLGFSHLVVHYSNNVHTLHGGVPRVEIEIGTEDVLRKFDAKGDPLTPKHPAVGVPTHSPIIRLSYTSFFAEFRSVAGQVFVNVNKTNKDEWNDQPSGTWVFLGVSASRAGTEKWEATFEFEHYPPLKMGGENANKIVTADRFDEDEQNHADLTRDSIWDGIAAKRARWLYTLDETKEGKLQGVRKSHLRDSIDYNALWPLDLIDIEDSSP